MTGNTIRSERDDFIAFSLAAADVLVAIDDDNRIEKVVGAARSLLRGKPEELVGKALNEIFDGAETSFVGQLIASARKHGRIEPSVVYLGHDGNDKAPANVGMAYLPDRNRLYLSLTILPNLVVQSLPKRNTQTGLLDGIQFQEIAAGGLGPNDPGSGLAMLKELRLIRLQGLPTVLERMPTQKAKTVMAEIGSFLRAQSCNGGVAAQLDGDRFGLIANKADDGESNRALMSHIHEVLERSGADPRAVVTQQQTLDWDMTGTSAADAAKALAFAINQFGKSDGLPVSSMADCLNQMFEQTVGRVNHIRDLLVKKEFMLVYQPIVDILTRDVHHYEALVRFDGGRSPWETISFGEKVGLNCDLDLAVAEMALTNMREHAGETIAVNVSGTSLENDIFRARFKTLLGANKAYASCLMIEVTESAMVEDMQTVAAYLAELRKRGNQICLDDFGAGANAYNYLRRFDADYVKIDGPFLKAALTEDRERAFVKSVSLLCHELHVPMIAEMIETEQVGQAAASLGIQFGQGYLYGKPDARIETNSPNLKRIGVSETWQ